jgi:GH35 family endo-1,4-beta-xylanase
MKRPHICLMLLIFAMLFSSTGETSNLSREQPIPRTLFGMHVGRVVDGTPWPNLSVPAWRLWDSQVKWPDLEPSKGQWRFDKLDKYVALAELHNTEVLLPLGTTPQWASSLPDVKSGWQAPGFTAAPADMNDWQTYVRQVVTRYKGRIRAYEIWNEPNLKQFWIGSTDQLVTMTKDAYAIIKSVDPAAILVSPAATGGPGVAWLADFLSKGGGHYVDVIGYHFYVFPHAPETILPLVERVKQAMKDNGAEDKPIWCTELGWAAPKPFLSEELAAAYVARSFIINWAAGIQRLYWYMWDNRNWVTIETTAADNKTVLPAGQAYGTIQKWLAGASMDSCNQSAGQIWTCELHRANQSQWIVWTAGKVEETFPVPGSWHAQSATSLVAQPYTIKESSIHISQVPMLLGSAASISAMGAVAIAATAPEVKPVEPRYTPSGGTYLAGQKITLSSTTPGAVIHYTVDGSQASVTSSVYQAPLVLSKGQIVRAIAVVKNVSSYEASASFNVMSSAARPQTPSYIPPGGAYEAGQKIALRSATPGAVVHYLVGGGQVSVSSPVYTNPLVLTKGEIVRAIAVVGSVSSYEASATFTVTSSPTSSSPSSPAGSSFPVSAAAHSPIPASFFGLTVLDFTKLSPSMPIGTSRSWDAYPNLDWSDANPSYGNYNFTYLDKFIALNRARGTQIIYTLGRTPRWASSKPNANDAYGPGECAPPVEMSYYDDYLRAVVTHVAGQIKYWEIWNEPQDTKFYCGDIPTMVTMAKHANQIIKEIDPTAMILSPSVTGGPGPAWLASFLSEGGASNVDVIAFHGYWSPKAEDVLKVIESYQAVTGKSGAAGKPLWDTESSWAGFGNNGTPSSAHQVGFVAKDYLLHWSQGVSRFVWYAYDGGAIWGGLWNSAAGESPAARSYRETYRWMAGATLTAPCSANTSGIWICPLSRPSGYLAEAVWIPNRTATFTVPSHYTEYRDLAGAVHPVTSSTVTVGDEPFLFETENLP